MEDNPETDVVVVAHDAEARRGEGARRGVGRDTGEQVSSQMPDTSPRQKKVSPKREFETTSELRLLVSPKPAQESKLSGLS